MLAESVRGAVCATVRGVATGAAESARQRNADASNHGLGLGAGPSLSPSDRPAEDTDDGDAETAVEK